MQNPESVRKMRRTKFYGILRYKRIIYSRPDDRTNDRQKKKKKKKRKRTCQKVDFHVRADNRVELKESKESDKYQDLATELKQKTNKHKTNQKKNQKEKQKKLWNMKVTVMPTVIRELGIVTKRISTGTGGFRNKRMGGEKQEDSFIKIGLRRRLEIWGTYCDSNSGEKLAASAGLKISQNSKMGLSYTNGSPNLGPKTRPHNNQQKKKENLQNCRLCCPDRPQNNTERIWKER